MKGVTHSIFFLLTTVVIIFGCTKESHDDVSEGNVRVVASIGNNYTKVNLSPAEYGTYDLSATWRYQEKLIPVLNNGRYTVLEPTVITDISEDKKVGSFYYNPGKSFTYPSTGYQLLCFTENCGPKVIDDEVYYNASIYRSDMDMFQAPMYAKTTVIDDQDFKVHFGHYMTYELLHVRNTSGDQVSFNLIMFQSPDGTWYNTKGALCERTGTFVNESEAAKTPITESGLIYIPKGGNKTIISAYIPITGKKISNATLVAEINGETVTSSNTKSSNVELKTGHAYHMYAEWDGKELKFVDAFSDASISVSTLSLEFGEVKVGESKTLSFDITNNTSEQISIGDIWSEDTNFTVDWMAGTIGPRETQTVNVTFTPDRAYVANGAFTVGNEKESYTVTYTAEGVAAGSNAEYVDLGLPSGTLWATCNLGASAPEEYGLYYQWGDTQGYGSDTNDGKYFDWSTYKWCDGSRYTLTKYNTDDSYGIVDNMVTLMSEDDAARAALGSKWRMPSNVEWEELLNNCTLTWTTVNGVNGYKLQSKVPGYADSWIFLPASGARSQDNLVYVGDNGYYYSSSIALYLPYGMSFLFFSSSSLGANMAVRSNGMSIRPVYAETEPSTVSVTTTDIDFGDVKVGTSVSKTFKITNTGSKATNVTISESYGIATSDFSGVATLAAGESKTITLTCSPNEIGSFNGGIDIIAGNWCQITYKGNAVESTDSGDPLTFTSTGSTTISLSYQGTKIPVSLEYNLNGGGWSTYTIRQEIALSDGDKVSFRAGPDGNTTFASNESDYDRDYFVMSGSGTIAASGSILSLLDAECKITSISHDYCFSKIFKGCSRMTTAPELPATTLARGCYYRMFYGCTSLPAAPELPATTLVDYCYLEMFRSCTSLTAAPELPATTLAEECYSAMFYGCTSLMTAPKLPATALVGGCYFKMFEGCTSLTTAPELPATTLATACYRDMFYGCTSLTAAPELPATTLQYWCYFMMFYGCTSLTAAPELPATTLAEGCYQEMFYGCKSLTAAPELPATTLADYCYYSMFGGCVSLKTAPSVLPATTLVDYCYQEMFRSCTSLTTAPELPATTLVDYCYEEMFRNCTSLTTAPALPATTITSQCYYRMFEGCTSLTAAPALPATTLADGCYLQMFYNCTSLTAAPALPATTLVDYCYLEMFRSCTSLTAAPELPATALAANCYKGMFYKCSKLNYVKMMATDIPNNAYLGDWLYGVSKTGTFVKNPAATWTREDADIPSGWTIIDAE